MTFPTNLTPLLALTEQGELIPHEIAECIDLEELQYIVENYPRNSYGMFFNESFEDENYVFIMNGEWYFFDIKFKEKGKDSIIQKWDWHVDPTEIVESYENDFDEIERFNKGWQYVSGDSFEDFDIIFKKMTNDSPMIQFPMPTADTGDFVIKSQIRKIMKDRTLNESQKVEVLYNLIKKQGD